MVNWSMYKKKVAAVLQQKKFFLPVAYFYFYARAQ